MFAHTTVSRSIPTNSIICHGLQSEIINRLYEIRSIQDVPAKQTVFMEGDATDAIFEVLDGVVLLSKLTMDGRRQITGFVYPGQLFGMTAGTVANYTAESVTAARVCRYPRKTLDLSMAAYPALGRRFLDWAGGELLAAQNQILLLGRKSAMEKVASFLLHISERNDEQDLDPTRLFVPMTRCDMADYLGLTTETVSRTITRLKNLKVIEAREHGYFQVIDLDRLVDCAEDEVCSC